MPDRADKYRVFRGSSPKGWTALACALSAVFSLIFVLRASFILDGQRYFTLFDDAMVSMRYARTFADGQGLVWNAGEAPVEGYTNFLWTLWMAVVHLLHVPDRLTSLVISISGAAIVVATAIAAAQLAASLTADERGAAGALASWNVALCYPLLFWSLRGMEVGLLALLVVLAVRRAVAAGTAESPLHAALRLLLAFMTLTRPDGVLPAMLVAISVVFTVAPHVRKAALATAAVPVAVLIAHTAIRWMYYGSALPNTYYLKMTGIAVGVRLVRGADVLQVAGRYLAVPFVIAILNRRVYRTAASSLVVTVPLLFAAYTIYVGGDAWEWMPYTDRYLTPALPLLLAAASSTLAGMIARLRDGWRPAAFAASGFVLLAIVSGPGYADWARTRGAHVVDDANMAWMGVRIRQTTDPSTRIGVVWAGAVPYFSHRPAIDFLGKNDPVIARHPPVTEFYPGHDRFDYAYSIGALKPDLVVQLWFPPPSLFQQLADWGYEQVFGGVFAKRGAAVDVPRLREAFKEPTVLE